MIPAGEAETLWEGQHPGSWWPGWLAAGFLVTIALLGSVVILLWAIASNTEPARQVEVRVSCDGGDCTVGTEP